MTLRKITVDNSVRYVPKSEQTKEKKPNMTKNKKPISGGCKPNTRKQDKNFSKNIKKIVKDFTARGFGVPK